MNAEAITAALALLAGLVVFGLLMAAAVLMIRDTIRQRGRWGIPFTTPNCRQCRAPMPLVRVPANFRQGLWGGWTCSECGLEVDKWGEPIPDQTGPAKWRLDLDEPPDEAKPSRRADERTTPPNNDLRPG